MFARKSLEFEKKMILQKISTMTNLPTPGTSIMKVMLLLRDEDVAMRELIEAIRQNQSLVARILKLVNSGYYGLRKTIDSVDRAVNLLGILKVKQLVYSASIMDMFSEDEQNEWNHAYSSSVLMSDIMEEHEIPAASNLPLTVLMHDIGKVVLRRFSPKKFQMAVEMAHRDGIPVFEAENAVIHINHAEVGAWLLEKWQMTEDIFTPVAWHHSKELPPEQFLVETALVQFTNWVDCFARGIPCAQPQKELMDAAGFEEIDNDYWINYQREVIATIEKRDDVLVATKDEKAAAAKASLAVPAPAAPQPHAVHIPASTPVPQPHAAPHAAPQHGAAAPLHPVAAPVSPAPAAEEAPPRFVKTETERISRHDVVVTPAPEPKEEVQPLKTKTDTEKINKQKARDHTIESTIIKNIPPSRPPYSEGFFGKIMKAFSKFFNS